MKILFFVILGFTFSAKADLTKTTLFSLNLMYIDREYIDGGVSSKSKATDTDLRLMRVEKKFAYGGIFSQSSNDFGPTNRNSYGLSTGFYSEKDFYINFHYYLSSKYKAGGLEYNKGNGYEIDLGFVSKITSSFYAGLMIAHKEFKYSQSQDAGGAISDVSATHRELIPMFTFAVAFQ